MTPFPVFGATRFLAPSHGATARAAACWANDEEDSEDHRRTDGWAQHECLPSFSAVTDARGPLKSGGFGATDGIEADCSICMPIQGLDWCGRRPELSEWAGPRGHVSTSCCSQGLTLHSHTRQDASLAAQASQAVKVDDCEMALHSNNPRGIKCSLDLIRINARH